VIIRDGLADHVPPRQNSLPNAAIIAHGQSRARTANSIRVLNRVGENAVLATASYGRGSVAIRKRVHS
jgi:hypothetical protein